MVPPGLPRGNQRIVALVASMTELSRLSEIQLIVKAL